MTPEQIMQEWQEIATQKRASLAAPGVVSREQMAQLSGMEFLDALSKGELPSVAIGALMDFVPILAEPGRMLFQGTPDRRHYNPLGMVHGGYAATLLDSCVGCAIHTMLPAGRGYSTLELKVNYIRAMTDKTGPVRAEGKVIHVGAQTGIAEGRLTDVHGKLYAHATTTCIIFPI